MVYVSLLFTCTIPVLQKSLIICLQICTVCVPEQSIRASLSGYVCEQLSRLTCKVIIWIHLLLHYIVD